MKGLFWPFCYCKGRKGSRKENDSIMLEWILSQELKKSDNKKSDKNEIGYLILTNRLMITNDTMFMFEILYRVK